MQTLCKHGEAWPQIEKYRIVNVIDCKDLLLVQVEGFLVAPDRRRGLPAVLCEEVISDHF